MRLGKQPLLNRDYFWTLNKIAEFAEQSAHDVETFDKYFSPLLLQPVEYKPNPRDVQAEERQRTDHKLKWIARNSKNPFAEWPLADMLTSTGWNCFEACAGGEILFIPPWKTKKFSARNYRQGGLGEDYFNVRGVVDHLEVSGCRLSICVRACVFVCGKIVCC